MKIQILDIAQQDIIDGFNFYETTTGLGLQKSEEDVAGIKSKRLKVKYP